MEDKTKKKLYGIGAIFVAIIFIFSYAAFSNNGSAATSTTTVAASNTIYVFGSANGIIVNYSYTSFITASNAMQAAQLNNTLATLEANGTISNFVQVNASTYEAIPSTINTYQLYQYLATVLNDTNVSVGGDAYVTVPAKINMYYSGSAAVPVDFPPKNYTVYLTKTEPINSSVPLMINALITTTGVIYNNNVRLTEG